MKKYALVLSFLLALLFINQYAFSEESEYKIFRFYGQENYGYKIPYQIIGGELKEIKRACINDHSVTLSINSNEAGRLTIDIPRTFFDAKAGKWDDEFLVLIDGIEGGYEEIVSEESRLATVEFSKTTSEIVFAGTIAGLRNYCEKPDPNSAHVFILSPKHQLKNGILPEEIICKGGLELVFKSTDGSPACVKPKTAEKLIERGWAS